MNASKIALVVLIEVCWHTRITTGLHYLLHIDMQVPTIVSWNPCCTVRTAEIACLVFVVVEAAQRGLSTKVRNEKRRVQEIALWHYQG